MSVFVGDGTTGVEARADRLGLPTGTTDPATAEAGDMYYKTDTNKIRVYDGTAWADLASSDGGGGDGGGGGGTTAIVNNSLRFGSDIGYLHRTPSSATNSDNWTYSTWIKITDPSKNNFIFGSGQQSENDGVYSWFRINDGEFQFRQWVSGVLTYYESTPTFRDPSAWYHIVLVYDSPNNAANERFRLYVNGKRVNDWDTRTNPGQNTSSWINSTKRHQIGLPYDGGSEATTQSSSQFNGMMAEIHLVDGLSLGPASFAEVDSTTGVWNPKEFTGTSVNDGTTWSSSSSDPNSVKQSGAASALFAGNLTAGGITLGQGSYYTALDGVSITCHKSVSCWMANGASTATMRINGDDALKVEAQSTTNQWVTLDFTGTITKIELGYLGGSGSANTFYALEVDGQVLLDTTTQTHAHGTNGFHLDFANGITDSSPNTNNFAAVGVVPVTYNGEVQYGEASPFDNSFDTNADVTLDTTGYAYSIVTSPKTDTGDANNATVLKTTDGTAIYWVFSDDNENTNRYIHQSSNGINWTGALYQTSNGPVTIGPAAWVAWAGGSNSDVTTIAWQSDEVLVDSPNNGTASTGADPGGSVVGNYAILNPISAIGDDTGTLKDGALSFSGTSSGQTSFSSTIATEKFYYEAVFDQASGNGVLIGVLGENQVQGVRPGQVDDGYIWRATSGTFFINGNNIGSYGSYGANGNNYIGVAVDSEAGTLEFFVNGVSQGVATSALPPGKYFAVVADGGNTSTLTNCTVNFGQTKFKYAAPAGFKSLCSTNLPTPAISKGSSYVDAKPYFGTGANNPQALGFTPDLLIIKRRDGANASGVVLDSIRGATKALETTNVNLEKTNDPAIGSFTAGSSDGFSLTGTYGQTNDNGSKYAAWVWDAGETTNSVSAGGLNSSAYDQSQTWSSSLTSTQTFNLATTRAFDGDLSTLAATANDTTANILFTKTFTNVTTLRIYMDHATNYRVRINGGTWHTDSSLGASSNASWRDLTSIIPANGTVNSIESDTDGQNNGVNWSAVEVNGRLLIDQGVTPPTNVPSIATSYRATPSAGCSVVSYSGVDTPSVNTVAHGLNKAPELYIIKNRTSNSANGWIVNTTVIDGSVDWAVLNGNGAKNDQGSPWSTTPTPYVFTLGANDNNTCDAGNDYIAYCFHSVDGFSKIGTFQNADDTGQFVYCGFKPRVILAKNMVDLGGQTGVGDWMIYDTARNPFNGTGDQNTIALNEPNQEDDYYAATQATIDILSNGFKIRHYNSSPLGDPNRLFWFAAWAENPFALNSRAV